MTVSKKEIIEKLSDEDFEKIENLICGTKAETLAELEEKKTRLELSEKLNKYLFGLEKENEELKKQLEKMKCFIHSEIDFCMYCPLTNECENSEGTCPYAYATEEEQKNLLIDFIQKWELNE